MSDQPSSAEGVPAPWIYDEVKAWFHELPQRPIPELVRDCVAKSADRSSLPGERTRECQWSQTMEGEGEYETTCGHTVALLEGTTPDADERFCCYCGAPLTTVPYSEAPQ